MAARIAHKIPCLVNNVVLRTQSASIPRQFQPILTAGIKIQNQSFDNTSKTRYPLNQQDANSYIDSLKAKAATGQSRPNNLDQVRTFNVLVNVRPSTTKTGTIEVNSVNVNVNCQRGLAQKDCKKKDCKPKNKCPKMSDNDKCLKFKLKNCEATKNFVCNRRPFIFKDCKKMPCPYPSFSEACYEGPIPSVNECRDCPWVEEKHPTFVKPKDKYGPPGRKYFHTDARHLRHKIEESKNNDIYESLNKAIFNYKSCPQTQWIQPKPYNNVMMYLMGKKNMGPRHKLGGKKLQKTNRPKKPPGECDKPCQKIPFRPTPTYDIKKKQMKINKEKEEKAKRGKSTCKCKGFFEEQETPIEMDGPQSGNNEGMLCKMIPKKPSNPNDMTCEKLAPSPVCPNNLLDRKPYPKYRKFMKKRIAKEQEEAKKRKAIKARKQAEKPPKGKKCAGVERKALWVDVLEYPQVNSIDGNRCPNMGNVILAKDRIKIEGAPICIKNKCDPGAYPKKKCDKKIKSRICPKDLLDRKPYKKYREKKTKCEQKKKGKKRRGRKSKGKRAAGLTNEEMNAMLMVNTSVPSPASRSHSLQ